MPIRKALADLDADTILASIIDPEGKAHPLWVQDYYHPDAQEDKWAAVKGLLDASFNAGKTRPLVINHTSGYIGALPDYRANARNINSIAATYILEKGAPAGIVMMDFAGVERSNGVSVGGETLLKTLIENN